MPQWLAEAQPPLFAVVLSVHRREVPGGGKALSFRSGSRYPATAWRPPVLSVPARPDVAEERPALDQLGDFGGNHVFPGVVVHGYSAQHVAAEDRQEFRPEVVEVNEAAPAGEVVVQWLQLWLDADVTHGRELVFRRGLQGVDIELQVVLEKPTEAFQDSAGKLHVVLLV